MTRTLSIGTMLLSCAVAGFGQVPLPAEALDGQVQAWRRVRAEDDVPTNVRRLRDMGFSAATVSGILPTMMRLWSMPQDRDFATLGAESIARVREIDRDYAVRWREIALQLHRDAEVEGTSKEARADLEKEWLAKIQASLGEEEARNFGLLNSSIALRLREQLSGVPVSADEKIALVILLENHEQRLASGEVRRSVVASMSERMKLQRGAELILGPDRFLQYLRRAVSPFRDFEQMVSALPAAEADTALKLWWIRNEYQVAQLELDAIEDREARREARIALKARTDAKLAATISPRTLAALELSPAGHWLPKVPPPDAESFRFARKPEK